MNTLLPGRPVVVGIDGSDHSLDAVRWAAREAVALGIPLIIATATGDRGALTPTPWAESRLKASRVASRRHVDRALTIALADQPRLRAETLVRATAADDLLIELGGQAALLAVGSRGLGRWGALALGSVSHAVASRCDAPVLVAKGTPATDIERVVIGHDGTTAADTATAWAMEYAELHRLPVTVVHAVWYAERPATLADDEATLRVSALVERLQARHPTLDVAYTAVLDNPVDALLAHTPETAILVIGTSGTHRRGASLLGSVSQRIMEKTSGTVVVVPRR
ncbi:MAG: universal stress protein [Nocardioidaceae bacterium]